MNMDNVILEPVGGNEVKIIRFGVLMCIKDKKDIEIDGDFLRWKDEDGDIVLKRKSGFMTLAIGGTVYNLAKDGSIDYAMPE